MIIYQIDGFVLFEQTPFSLFQINISADIDEMDQKDTGFRRCSAKQQRAKYQFC